MTVLFSDLCGSTRLGHEADPEVLDQVLAELKSAASRIITKHDGSLVQFHGDGVLAMFGHPTPHEDDVRRATEAALEYHDAVRQLDLSHLFLKPFEIRLHSGIHSGLVLVRAGGAVQGRFELVGDPPNTAAGICARAGVDEILVSESTLIGSLPFFETEAVEPLVLKGKPDPIPAYRVLARSDVRTRFEASRRRGLTPLVGREPQLESLQQGLVRASKGSLTRIRIVGDAGIGKTRLVEEFLREVRARDGKVFSSYCEDAGSAAPLHPFRMMLRQAFELGDDRDQQSIEDFIKSKMLDLGLDAHLSEILPLLAERPSSPADASALARAIAELMTAVARNQFLVVFVDDWQWVDDASRTLATALMGPLRDQPILWVTAARPTRPGEESGVGEGLLTLPPFADDESSAAIQTLTSAQLDHRQIAKLHNRSGGNPLFLEELCRSLGHKGISAGEKIEVPSTLHGLIEDHVESLPMDQAEAVRAASVIGNNVPSFLLERITGLASSDIILSRLAENDLLYDGPGEGMFRFKHGITRDAIYQSVPLAKRRRIHTEIAEFLDRAGEAGDGEASYEILAYHFEGAARYVEASNFAELAGDRAWAGAALDRARKQYRAALSSLDQLSASVEVQRRWLDISSRRAFACVFNPAPEQLEMLGRAVEIASDLGDLDAEGHAYFWMGFIAYSLGDQEASIRHYRMGLEIAEKAGNEKLIAQLRANLGQSRASACDYEEALKLLDESIESKQRLHKRKSSKTAPTGSAFAIACKAFVMAEMGETEQGEKLMQESLAAVGGTGHPVEGSCYSFYATMMILQGRFGEAIEIADVVRKTGERVNGPYLFGRGRSEGAFARYMNDRNEEALAALEETTQWLERRPIRLYISLNYGYLAEAMFLAQEPERARHYAGRALERAAQLDVIGEGMACRVLARLGALEEPDRLEASEPFLVRAFASARKRGSRREIALLQLTRSEIAVDRGDFESARDGLQRNQMELDRMQLAWYSERARSLADRLVSTGA